MKDTAVYAASIGAITQLTKVIAVEYGSRGIRANAVAPGVIETDIREGRCHGRAL
jgi:NAD(P)-dependent dehydrogenase (short-subunit alcohol dehydrogenase family)